jgi:AraC-like DNA-binding protein
MSGVHVLDHHFASMDEFICGLTGLGVEASVCQLDTSLKPASFTMASSESTRLFRFDIGNCAHHLLGPEPGCETFGILVGEQAPTRIGSREFGPTQILRIDPETGLDALLQPGFSGYTVSVRQKRLQQLGALDGRFGQFGGPPRTLPPSLQRVLRHGLSWSIAEAQSLGATAELEQFLEYELPRLMLLAWSTQQADSIDRSSLAGRSRARERALHHIWHKGKQSMNVAQLCIASASSYSSLERAFREYFGLSPKQYLIRHQLSRVRQSLVDARGRRSVTEVAHEWGFNHMGKFATSYRLQFGELPSETTRGMRQISVAMAPQQAAVESVPTVFR